MEVVVASSPAGLEDCDKIILPGVGAYASGMANLNQRGLVAALNEQVLERGKLFLGICLGMQIILERSHEHGLNDGLGWIKGEVLPLSKVTDKRLPHMGWHDTTFRVDTPLLEGIDSGSDFYYVHGFYAHCAYPENVLATCDYGIDFHSVIGRDNIFGVQFHPEKSQRHGLKIIENFVRM